MGAQNDVNGGLYRVQDITIGDASGTNMLAVWGNDIGTMKKGKSYRIIRVCVKEYHGKKNLSTSKEGSGIHLIEDIGDVLGEDKDDSGKIRIYI